jgi:hypothetical protein
MVGLNDIAPASETDGVQGEPVTLHGVSAKGLALYCAASPSCAC